MAIKIIKNPVSRQELRKMAQEQFGNLLKAVVDVEKEIVAIGGELHSDEEVLLIEKEGSKRQDTWGINFYPEKPEGEWIEFDSLINLKPSFGNRSRGVEDAAARKKIKEIIRRLVLD